MRRTAMVAGIVALVAAGVVWALAAHHGGSPTSFGTVQKVVSNIGSHLPKHLPDVGKCLNGNLKDAGSCIGRHIPGIPGIGTLPGIGTGASTQASVTTVATGSAGVGEYGASVLGWR